MHFIKQWCWITLSSIRCIFSRRRSSDKAGCQHLGALKGLGTLFAESDKDGATAEDAKLGVTVIPKQVTSALSSLVANYGSTSESEPEGELGPNKLFSPSLFWTAKAFKVYQKRHFCLCIKINLRRKVAYSAGTLPSPAFLSPSCHLSSPSLVLIYEYVNLQFFIFRDLHS